MVLVNGLTIDDINAALIALQRGQGEVVGGVKNTTVQNISISNSGGSGGPDFTPQINALQETAADLTERVETLEDKQTETEQTIDEIITRLNNAGIQRVIWQESNRTLYFYMSDRQLFVEIPAETVTLTLGNDNVLHFTMGEGENAFPQTIDLALPFIRTSEKGVAGGVASLDSNGRVPYSQLPESAMEYKGKWDASTNTPHLADGTGTNGDFYVCSAPGTVTFGTGNTITFVVNDRVIYDGTDDMWEKLPAGAVSSVNGQTGDVTLDANDIDYSSTKTVKQAIDDIQPVQADWEQSDSSAPDFIKNKIPIWIASGTSPDNIGSVFDIVHPIGEVYIQYPGKKDPNTLWGTMSEWTDITANYNGAFFRAYKNGTSGDFFDGTLGNPQAQGTAKNGLTLTKSGSAYGVSQTVTGGSHSHTYTYAAWSDSGTGYIYQGSSPRSPYNITVSGGSHSHTFTPSVTDNISYSVSGDTETRPSNYAIKIWERTL